MTRSKKQTTTPAAPVEVDSELVELLGEDGAQAWTENPGDLTPEADEHLTQVRAEDAAREEAIELLTAVLDGQQDPGAAARYAAEEAELAAEEATDGQRETQEKLDSGELHGPSEPVDQAVVEAAVAAGTITVEQGVALTSGYGDPALVEQLTATPVDDVPTDTTLFLVQATNCYGHYIDLGGKNAHPVALRVVGEAELAAVLGLRSGWFVDGDKVERHHIVEFRVTNTENDDETAVYRRIKNEDGEKVAVLVDVALEEADQAAAQAAAGEGSQVEDSESVSA